MSENCFSASASRPPTTVCSVRSVGSAISSSLLTSSRGDADGQHRVLVHDLELGGDGLTAVCYHRVGRAGEQLADVEMAVRVGSLRLTVDVHAPCGWWRLHPPEAARSCR